jgi:hypothetical protein
MVPWPWESCPIGLKDCVGRWQGDLLGAVVMSIALVFASRSQINRDRERHRKDKFKELSKDIRPKRRRFKRKKS